MEMIGRWEKGNIGEQNNDNRKYSYKNNIFIIPIDALDIFKIGTNTNRTNETK